MMTWNRTLKNLPIFIVLLWLSCSSARQHNLGQNLEILYVGTFSVRGSEGIYSYVFDRKNQQFNLLETTKTPESPTFIAINASGDFLVSANREGLKDTPDYGSLGAFKINKKTGKLSAINESSSFGVGPCHVSFGTQDRDLYVSHYHGGSLAVFSMEQDGAIGPLKDSLTHQGSSTHLPQQEKAHVHSIQTIPGTDYFLVADLGTDQLNIYQLEKREIIPAPLAVITIEPGSGPRHFTFLPGTKFLYVAEELSSTVSVHFLDMEKRETRQLQRISTLPEGFSEENSVADLHFSPDGRYLYVSNRGHDSLAIYAVDQTTGLLRLIGHQPTGGSIPRNFWIDPQGDFILVANQATDDIRFFKRDKETGFLQATSIELKVPSPVCLKMVAW